VHSGECSGLAYKSKLLFCASYISKIAYKNKCWHKAKKEAMRWLDQLQAPHKIFSSLYVYVNRQQAVRFSAFCPPLLNEKF
jgi:hypothetical protein